MLSLTMRRLKALELLEDSEYCWGLNMHELESLLVRAGYKREEAHRAALDHGFNRLSSGKTA